MAGEPGGANSLAARSLEDSVGNWPRVFQDLNSGGDTRRWQKLCLGQLAPSALFGQEVEGSGFTFPRTIEPDETVCLSFPCFVDDDPVDARQFAGNGTKVKFNGKSKEGVICVTDRTLALMQDAGRHVLNLAVPVGQVSEVNELKFKFSMVSMTSAGPGFEVFSVTSEGTIEDRLLFRVALTPRNGVDIGSLLRRSLQIAE